jgi:hypothetical protein
VDLAGSKFKDMDADGVKDAGEPGLADFTFTLKSGTTTIDTAVSDANGNYTFEDVPAGSYTVAETPKTGWLQTLPASNGTRSVTVLLTSTSPVTIDPFGNTPLTDLQVLVEPQTGASQGTIFCVAGEDLAGAHLDGNGGAAGTDVDGAPGADATWDLNDLTIGTYTCKVVITDP